MLLLLSFLAGLLSACSVTTPVNAPELENILELPPPPPEKTTYRLQAGDELSIKFYNNPELDEEQPVRPDGRISLPFVGQIEAGGKTPGDLEEELIKRYTGELASPQVSVIVQEYAPERYFVGGEVGSQGAYEIHGRVNLLQAIQEAGGFTPTARQRQVVLIRENEEGEHQGYAIDMKAMQSGEPSQMVYLYPQDVVFVPRSHIANVDLWVVQYVRGVLPTVPGFGFNFDNR